MPSLPERIACVAKLVSYLMAKRLASDSRKQARWPAYDLRSSVR
jgi:hypothetical protein